MKKILLYVMAGFAGMVIYRVLRQNDIPAFYCLTACLVMGWFMAIFDSISDGVNKR